MKGEAVGRMRKRDASFRPGSLDWSMPSTLTKKSVVKESQQAAPLCSASVSQGLDRLRPEPVLSSCLAASRVVC